MKKRLLILGLIPMLLCGCSKENYNNSLEKVQNSGKNSLEKVQNKTITITYKGELVDCVDGHLEEVFNGNKVINVVNDYIFNYTVLTLDGDVDITTFARISGKLTYDNYVIILDKVNLDYFYCDDLNKNSLYLRVDCNKLKYELRTNTSATLEITNVWQFVENIS